MILISLILLLRNSKKGIENRPIISGNFLKQPALKKYKFSQKSNDFPNANYVHEFGFFVGLKNKVMSEIETKKLTTNARIKGELLHKNLLKISLKFPDLINIYGKGLIAAIVFNSKHKNINRKCCY